MDRECVSLLPRVCEVLAGSRSSLPDDTSLEKLLDWLTEAGGSLLETCPCLLDFMSTVIKNTDSDPGVLSFALRLSGLMAATEDGFRTLKESSILDPVFSVQHWQKAGLWEDPCIRIGWIQGLRSMLQHMGAFRFFVQSDFIQPLLQLQTDTSLFVAVAANQTLAHVLLFFEPASPAGSNGADKKDEDIDLKQLDRAADAGVNHAALVGEISKHLEASLVPVGKEQLHQSLQNLRLLALVLAQAGPDLRDALFCKVTASLEELVAAGHRQLTLPLVDVILAASSSGPDERVSHLLSSVLNIDEPVDLVHAAAAFLRRGRLDPVHTAQVVRTLLLPLSIITGNTLLGSDTSDERRSLMLEQLKKKTSCISMICICLTNTPQIALMPPDVLLTSPPVSIVLAVLSVLRICSGDSSPSSPSCGEVHRNMTGSAKVQKCALEALTALSSSSGAKDKMKEVFTVLIQYLDNPDSDPTVMQKSFKALIKWMSVCSTITDHLRQELTRVVQKRACDMRWEVRDSAVEFLGQLAGVRFLLDSAEEASEAPGGCWTTPLLREALQDPESYVRASATSALAQTLAHSWQQGAALSQDQTQIVSRLLEILSEDTEGFARRAVVRYFIAWFSSRVQPSPPLLADSVRSVLLRGSVDLDWEVKVHTLQLAELLLDEAFAGHRGYGKSSDTDAASPHPYAVAPAPRTYTLPRTSTEGSDPAAALQGLVQQGVFTALLNGLVDCDRPVGLKACRLLITLRDTVCPRLPGAPDATAATATVARVSWELPQWGCGPEIRKLLWGKESSGEVDSAKRDEAGEEAASGRSDGVCVGVCDALCSLDLDERLDVLTRSSDHVQNSLLSLLQDILTASGAHTHHHTQEQEVIVDCY